MYKLEMDGNYNYLLLNPQHSPNHEFDFAWDSVQCLQSIFKTLPHSKSSFSK